MTGASGNPGGDTIWSTAGLSAKETEGLRDTDVVSVLSDKWSPGRAERRVTVAARGDDKAKGTGGL